MIMTERYLAGVLPTPHPARVEDSKKIHRKMNSLITATAHSINITHLLSKTKFTEIHKSPWNWSQILQTMFKPCNRGAIAHIFYPCMWISKTWFHIREGLQPSPLCRRRATAISNQVHSVSDWNPGVSLRLRQGLSFQGENRSQNLYYL